MNNMSKEFWAEIKERARLNKIKRERELLIKQTTELIICCRLQQKEFNKKVTGRSGFDLLKKSELPEHIKERIVKLIHNTHYGYNIYSIIKPAIDLVNS
jgi:hypothetical protein